MKLEDIPFYILSKREKELLNLELIEQKAILRVTVEIKRILEQKEYSIQITIANLEARLK